jgi:hypothetical protein
VSLDGSTKIPEDIRNNCLQKFGSIPNFDVPDICGKMEHTTIYTDDMKRPLLPEK